jgi:hypothetical protein
MKTSIHFCGFWRPRGAGRVCERRCGGVDIELDVASKDATANGRYSPSDKPYLLVVSPRDDVGSVTILSLLLPTKDDESVAQSLLIAMQHANARSARLGVR